MLRALKLIGIVAVVAAIAVPAQAITLLQPYSGPVTMKYRNWDTGTLYAVADGTYTGEGTLDALPQLPPPSRFGLEDSWAVVELTEIRGASNELLWSGAIPGTPEITGILFGERDTYLSQTTSVAGISQDIHGHGFQIAWFEDANPATAIGDPAGTFTPTANTGTARRTGQASFDGATEGTLLWTLSSIPGFDGNFPSDEFFTTFSPSGGIFFGGNNAFGGMWLELDTIWLNGPDGRPGVAGVDDDGINGIDDIGERGWAGSDDIPLTGTNQNFFVDQPSPDPDQRAVFTGKPDPSQQFLVISDDPIDTVLAIPEPLTLVGMALGIGGLARYTRKRRSR